MKTILLPVILLLSNFAIAQTELQTYIPDDNFEQALIDLGYDDILDDYVITTGLKEIIQLDLNQSGVLDLTGLEALSGLEWLRIDNRLPGSSPINKIDVSQNVNLEILLLQGNSLKEIDLSKNDKLRGLDLAFNSIETIDLSNNLGLVSIVLYSNKLQELDLSKNEKLVLYNVTNNELTSLNLQNGNNYNFAQSVGLAGNPNLKCIQVDDAEFSANNQYWIKDDHAYFSEDCSVPPSFTYVPDDNFEQSLIDLGYDDILDNYVLTDNIKAITALDIERREIGDLKGIEDFLELKILKAPVNNLTALDLSQNINLEIIMLQYNNLADINLPLGTKLTKLSIDHNPLQALDISKQNNLEFLLAGDTKLSTLNLSNNSKLSTLSCGNTDIKFLDLSNNENLKVLGVPNNHLMFELDLSNNIELEVLNSHRAAIKSLDLSANINLRSIEADHMNSLTNINLKNGNNNQINPLLLHNNENLACIQVDNKTFAINNSLFWTKDNTAYYSEDCSAPFEDSDDDGVRDDLDICPSTPEGQSVNEEGCSLSQYADIAVQNVAIGLGSYLCSDIPNCTVDVSVLKDVDLNLIVVKNGSEVIFDGIVGISSPLALENLAEGEYSVCVTRDDIPNFEQCYQVYSNSTENRVSTTIVMQNPDQMYTLSVAGSQSYELTVNGNSTLHEFDSVEEQELVIPLQVGSNTIEVKGLLDCNDLDIDGEIGEESEEIETTDKLNLFPTLTNGKLILQNNQLHQIAGISITGLSGKTVKLMSINDNPEEINLDLRGTAKGLYVVRIQKSNSDVIYKKVMIR